MNGDVFVDEQDFQKLLSVKVAWLNLRRSPLFRDRSKTRSKHFRSILDFWRFTKPHIGGPAGPRRNNPKNFSDLETDFVLTPNEPGWVQSDPATSGVDPSATTSTQKFALTDLGRWQQFAMSSIGAFSFGGTRGSIVADKSRSVRN